MQGVHRVIQSLFLFDVVSGHTKQLPSPYNECFLGSRNAVGESSLINLKECSLVQIPPRSAVQRFRAACTHDFPRFRLTSWSEVCRIFPNAVAGICQQHRLLQSLNTMAPVIPAGKRLAFATAVEFGASFIHNQGTPAVDRTVQSANSISRLRSIRHLDERKSPRLARIAIRDGLDCLNCPIRGE